MDDEELPLLTLEDMAVASVAHPLVAEELGVDGVRWDSVVGRWQTLLRAGGAGFRPFRVQPLLVDMLEVLRANRIETLHRWQVAVLLRAMELAASVPGPGDVFREALGPHENDLRLLAGHHGPVYELAGNPASLQYVTSKEIAASKPREVKTVAGIDLTFVGPLYSQNGPVKVLDSVPDRCTVVVEGGTCLVNGYVFGRVIATDGCHVGRNVSGMIVTRQGKVTAEGFFRRAFVITKHGHIECRTTENPSLMFAGTGIDVAERTVMGVYVSPRIRVGDEAYGGTYAVSDRMTAPRVRSNSDRPASIFLQRAIMPEDYGEILGWDARRLTIQWVKLRQQLIAAERLVKTTEDEIERTAGNAVSYLLGGDVVRKELEELRQLERRLTFLDRLIGGLDTLNDSFENGAAATEDDLPGAGFETGWEEVVEELSESEEPADATEAEREWAREEAALQQLKDSLSRQRVKTRAQEALFRWNERRLEWLREKNALLTTVERKRADLRRLMTRAEHVGKLDLSLSKQRQLAALLESLRLGAGDEWAERAGKPFMRVLLRNIARLRTRSDRTVQVVPKLRAQLRQLSEKLRSEHSIRLDLDDTRQPPRVTAQFDPGVRIYARRFREADTPDDVFHVTPPGAVTRTYIRDGNMIVESESSTADGAAATP